MGKSRVNPGSTVNWNHVFYFSRVASLGSLKAAAESLSLSPSTLSEHVAQLESDLQVQLFHRHHRQLTLTDQGARLYRHAKQMFESGLRLIDVVSPVPLGQYPVSIGLAPAFSLPMAYELIRQFISQNRGVNVKLQHSRNEELEKGLADSTFDFGFTNQAPERKDLSHRLICSSKLGFYVSSRASQNKSFVELFAELPLLLCSVEGGRREDLLKALAGEGMSPVSIVSSDYPGLARDLCQRGQGIGIFAFDLEHDFAREGLRLLRSPRRLAKLQEDLFAIWPKGTENSAPIQRLLSLLSARSS